MFSHQSARKKMGDFFAEKTLALPCIGLRICSTASAALTLIADFR
jgi:hypothetical protein